MIGDYSKRRLRERTGRHELRLRHLIRRLAVKLSGDLWQLLGYEDEAGKREVFADLEAFQGIGFRSRPRSGKGEAIVVQVGESAHSVIVQTRDKEIEIELEEDETAIFNSGSRVIVKANGQVHIDDGSGAVALATKADIDALAAEFNAHLHQDVQSGSGFSGVPTTTAPVSAGTSILRGK